MNRIAFRSTIIRSRLASIAWPFNQSLPIPRRTPAHLIASLIVLLCLQVAPATAAAADVTNLRCEYRVDPLGIDVARPRLSWVIQSDTQGDYQTACHVLVASTPELLAKHQGDLWDSGQITSDQSVHVEYGGKPLFSRDQCYWKVRVWDKKGRPSNWSPPARWTMGLLDPKDWRSAPIGPAGSMAKGSKDPFYKDWDAAWIKARFTAPAMPSLEKCSWIWFPHAVPLDQTPPGDVFFRARLQLPLMCADNAFTLFVNAKEALTGSDWRTPHKAKIAEFLQAGENILAVKATNGDIGPNPAGLIGQVMVQLADGRRLTVDTGSGWKAHDRELTGWRKTAFDDASWAAAREITKYGGGLWGNIETRDHPNAPAPWVRKVLTLTGAPERALAYVNVMGYYELYVNGHKVGDEVLAPAVSDYARRSFYKTYDITNFLHAGSNCVGLWMDMGWYRAGPIARVQIDMVVDGQPVRLGTDKTWTCAPSHYTALGPWAWGNMGGERVDARREITDWSEPDCSSGQWIPAEEVTAPHGGVVEQACPANRIGKVIPLAACKPLGTNTWELDFGTNLTGSLRLRMPPLPAGQRVRMVYADKPGQTFNQVDEFISAGKSGELFCSKFNYHGFRYVTVQGLPTKPEPGDAQALLIETDLKTAGSFSCSNDLFNRIYQTNLWTLRCLNLGGYMVDCPHRERLGYGDGQVSIESMIMGYDAAAFYGKWVLDWLDSQNISTGQLAHTAPESWSGGGPGWGGAGCAMPWKLYLYYGDRRLLERAYEPMRRYVEFLERYYGDNGVLRQQGDNKWQFIGDWVAPGRGMDTDNWPPQIACEVFNNCYRVYLWQILERSARALGKTQDAQNCAAKINEIRPLIHDAFYDEQKQIYALDEQSYQVMPLMTGVVPKNLRGTIMQKLEDGIMVKNKGHLDTGMLGTYFLIQYLQDMGRNDLLYSVFSQETYPGWGYMLAQGATTFWEQWNGYYSHIHSCFTSPGAWFYQGLAGIRPDETAPGFKKIIIKPAVVGDLTWVKSHYDSIHGRIVSNWQRNGDALRMDVTIPANTTATVFVPGREAAIVAQSSQVASQSEGVKLLRLQDNVAVYAVGSGTYQFQATLPKSSK